MRKIIAAFNMTLDGFCNHTDMIADDDLHEYYNDVLRHTGVLLYGRVTYQLMESYWPLVVREPTGNKPMDDFAVLIDDVEKIVYSRTLEHVSWKNSKLRRELNKEDIIELKQQDGNDIYVGSPSIISQLTQLDLIDAYHLSIQPTLLGDGLVLFKNIGHRVDLKLVKTKAFGSGIVTLYYERA